MSWTRGKKRILLTNWTIFAEKDLRYLNQNATPARKNTDKKKPKKAWRSKDSYQKKSKNRVWIQSDELRGKIFKSHNFNQLLDDTSISRNRKIGYYLPTQTGLLTYHWNRNNESVDLDAYLMNQKKDHKKLSWSHQINYGIEKYMKHKTKKKSTDQTPNRKSSDFNKFTIKSKSKSKSSKRSKKALSKDNDQPYELIRKASLDRKKTSSKLRAASRKQSKAKNNKEIEGSTQKLSVLYKKLCEIVENEENNPDKKMQDIWSIFSDYVELIGVVNSNKISKMNEDNEEADSIKLSSKILGFFSFYSKMNIESYIYTRSLTMEALKILEEFIYEEKRILSQYVPTFFMTQDQLTIVDAVKMIKEFSTSMIRENNMLTSYIKENMDTGKVISMVKNTMNEKKFKIESPGGFDLEDLKARLNETSVKRETYNSTKTRAKWSDRDDDEIPTHKQRTAFEKGSSIVNSLENEFLDGDEQKVSELDDSDMMNLRDKNGNRERTAQTNYGMLEKPPHISEILNLDDSSKNKIKGKGYYNGKKSSEKLVSGESSSFGYFYDQAGIGEQPDWNNGMDDTQKHKFKLDLPKQKPEEGFHEEFMKQFSEFSISWRNKILNEKNAKYYFKNN